MNPRDLTVGIIIGAAVVVALGYYLSARDGGPDNPQGQEVSA